MKRKYTCTFTIEGEALADDVPLNKTFLKETIRLLEKESNRFCKVSRIKITKLSGEKK